MKLPSIFLESNQFKLALKPRSLLVFQLVIAGIFGCILSTSYSVQAKAVETGQDSTEFAGFKLTSRELVQAIDARKSKIAEFRFLSQWGSENNCHIYAAGGTAAGLAHYVKMDLEREWLDAYGLPQRYFPGRFGYDYYDVYRFTQDADIILDCEGGAEANEALAKELESTIRRLYPHTQGSKSVWEVRLLRFSRGTGAGEKEPLLDNPNFSKQHTDSHSTGMIELTPIATGQSVVRDLLDWNNHRDPQFLKDVVQGELHFYYSPQHTRTKRYQNGINPEILSVIRYFTKAFQYGLRIRQEDEANLVKIIQAFDLKSASCKDSYVVKQIETNGLKLFWHSQDVEFAWNTLERFGLRQKLIAFGSGESEMSIWLNREPLRTRPLGQSGRTAKELGIETVAHETNSFLAYENITRSLRGKPNVFISRNRVAREAAVYGDGFYTARGRSGARGTGLTIRFRVDPNAREGIDFFTRGNDFVIFVNRSALTVIDESIVMEPFDYFEFLLREELLDHSDRGLWIKFEKKIDLKLSSITVDGAKKISELVLDRIRKNLIYGHPRYSYFSIYSAIKKLNAIFIRQNISEKLTSPLDCLNLMELFHFLEVHESSKDFPLDEKKTFSLELERRIDLKLASLTLKEARKFSDLALAEVRKGLENGRFKYLYYYLIYKVNTVFSDRSIAANLTPPLDRLNLMEFFQLIAIGSECEAFSFLSVKIEAFSFELKKKLESKLIPLSSETSQKIVILVLAEIRDWIEKRKSTYWTNARGFSEYLYPILFNSINVILAENGIALGLVSPLESLSLIELFRTSVAGISASGLEGTHELELEVLDRIRQRVFDARVSKTVGADFYQIDPVAYFTDFIPNSLFKAVRRDYEHTILNEIRRRVFAQVDAISPEKQLEIVDKLKNENFYRYNEGISLIEEWLTYPASVQHPDLIDTIFERHVNDHKFALFALKTPHWQRHPNWEKWVATLMKNLKEHDPAGMKDLVRYVLSTPGAIKNPKWIGWMEEVIGTLGPKGKEANFFERYRYPEVVQFVLSQPHVILHDKWAEWIEKLLGLQDMELNQTIVRYVFSQPQAMEHPKWPEWIEGFLEQADAGIDAVLLEAIGTHNKKVELNRQVGWLQAILDRGKARPASFAFQILRNPFWKNHPEWLETLLQRPNSKDSNGLPAVFFRGGAYSNYVAELLGLLHWKEHPDWSRWMETILANGSVDSTVVTEVLSQADVMQHPDWSRWIETILNRHVSNESGLEYGRVLYRRTRYKIDLVQALGRLFYGKDPRIPFEWVKKLIENDSELVSVTILENSVWKDHPELVEALIAQLPPPGVHGIFYNSNAISGLEKLLTLEHWQRNPRLIALASGNPVTLESVRKGLERERQKNGGCNGQFKPI